MSKRLCWPVTLKSIPNTLATNQAVFLVRCTSWKKWPGTGRTLSPSSVAAPRPVLSACLRLRLRLTRFTLQPTWNSMLRGWGAGGVGGEEAAVIARDLKFALRTPLLTWSRSFGAWVAALAVSGLRWPLTRWACRSSSSGSSSPSFSTTYSSTRVPLSSSSASFGGSSGTLVTSKCPWGSSRMMWACWRRTGALWRASGGPWGASPPACPAASGTRSAAGKGRRATAGARTGQPGGSKRPHRQNRWSLLWQWWVRVRFLLNPPLRLGTLAYVCQPPQPKRHLHRVKVSSGHVYNGLFVWWSV